MRLPLLMSLLMPLALNVAEPLQNAQVLRLWTGEAPGALGTADTDIPSVTVYLPKAGTATGAAVVVFPGGGYDHLSVREGPLTSQWLADNGITAFNLKYRLGPRYHHPVELGDAARSVQFVRANAAAWGLDPARVGIIGYSAGGHLASTLSTHFTAGDPAAADPVERASSRPDVSILVYPVVTLADEPNVHKSSRNMLLGANPPDELKELLSNERQISAQTPPTFIMHSTGDRTVTIANSDMYVAGLMKFNVPFVYLRGPYGGHGVGPTDNWTPACLDWLRVQKFLGPVAEAGTQAAGAPAAGVAAVPVTAGAAPAAPASPVVPGNPAAAAK